MADRYLETMLTPAVLAAEDHYYGRRVRTGNAPENNPLTDDEMNFIATRDSFYMASVTETGWPYAQHRGGKPGFLKVISPTELAFADYKGNRQLISTGNFSVNDRVSLFLMDYPQRWRLKILGHARVEDARGHPDLVAQLTEPEARPMVERLVFITVVSFDWNCSQYITPRYTIDEIRDLIAPLQQRIAELEAKVKSSGSKE